uniref:Uncharacterized protein n=1 Tax=Anguilla anguilla TaxID=7936 RepID=A0A0E9WKR6_ANGAN
MERFQLSSSSEVRPGHEHLVKWYCSFFCCDHCTRLQSLTSTSQETNTLQLHIYNSVPIITCSAVSFLPAESHSHAGLQAYTQLSNNILHTMTKRVI